eukprot:810197-Pyramimonas_sp.AAC.1
MLLILRRVQRKMLRLVAGVPWRRNELRQRAPDTSDDDRRRNMTDADAANNPNYTASNSDGRYDDGKEPWADYVRRATREATDHAPRAQVEEWVVLYSKRKWKWASCVATYDFGRWTF